MARGPNRMHCVYGEWEVPDAPECVPGTRSFTVNYS